MAGPEVVGYGVVDGVLCGNGASLAACVSGFGVQEESPLLLNVPRGCGALGWSSLG